MKVLVNGEVRELGAHIVQAEEVITPALAPEAINAARNEDAAAVMSAEDFAMWKKACDATSTAEELTAFVTSEYGWTL